jgi:hypothetical protein
MFEEARNGSWLGSLHEMLYKMTERIALIREKLQDNKGVGDEIARLVKKDG